MAPMPNLNLGSDTQFEGGAGKGCPVYVDVKNDVCCCFIPRICHTKINEYKEFKKLPGITCEHDGCTETAITYCNGDIKFAACGPRLHAGCGKNLC